MSHASHLDEHVDRGLFNLVFGTPADLAGIQLNFDGALRCAVVELSAMTCCAVLFHAVMCCALCMLAALLLGAVWAKVL